MKLNCKPGDLAVFVSSAAGNEGKIVQCIRLAGLDEIRAACYSDVPTWKTNRVFNTAFGKKSSLAYDYQLRPLRDNPGQDEILRIVGLPEKEPA